jgi:hypothetical protein
MPETGKHHNRTSILFKKYLTGTCSYDEAQEITCILEDSGNDISIMDEARLQWKSLNTEDKENLITTEDQLRLDQVLERINHRIRMQEEEANGMDPKIFRLINFAFFKYAAILFVFLSIGSIGYWGFNHNQKSYIYSKAVEMGKNGKSQLHLSDGTIVDLEKDNSKIALSNDQKITIEDEKVIDLNKTIQTESSKMIEMVVPFGKKSQLTLEDGTKVWLNAGSRMAFPSKFTGNKREIFLEGEGYFEVAHNQKLPFYVNTGEIAIKVLGTKFNVSAYESDKLIETVLIEGKISISEKSVLSFMKRESILMPNQKASYDRNDRSIVVKDEPNVGYAISWTEGSFRFYRQSINEVLNKLQRYYNVKFILSSGFPAEDLITGKLYLKDSIEEIMKSLDIVAKIQYRINGDNIYVGKRE